MISVLVVDDHDLVRSGISRLLADAKGIKVIGEANSGEDAITNVRKLEPNVVLMDVQMPGLSGLEATRKITRSNKDVKIIALTACDDNLFARGLFDAGASGYLTKGADLDEMILAIQKVVKGQKFVSTEIAQRMASEMPVNPFDGLSERELQIALMLVKH